MKNTHLKIGNRFRELREILHKTQVELSEELKVTQANLSQIENGKAMPNFKFNEKLAMLYPEINFNWILYGEGSPLRNADTERIKREAAQKSKQVVEKIYIEKISKLEQEIKTLKLDNSKLIEVVSKNLKKK